MFLHCLPHPSVVSIHRRKRTGHFGCHEGRALRSDELFHLVLKSAGHRELRHQKAARELKLSDSLPDAKGKAFSKALEISTCLAVIKRIELARG